MRRPVETDKPVARLHRYVSTRGTTGYYWTDELTGSASKGFRLLRLAARDAARKGFHVVGYGYGLRRVWPRDLN